MHLRWRAASAYWPARNAADKGEARSGHGDGRAPHLHHILRLVVAGVQPLLSLDECGEEALLRLYEWRGGRLQWLAGGTCRSGGHLPRVHRHDIRLGMEAAASMGTLVAAFLSASAATRAGWKSCSHADLADSCWIEAPENALDAVMAAVTRR